jgi:MOB kinase activator 1
MFPFFKGKKKDVLKPIFLNQPFVSASLVNGSFKKLVQCPEYMDLNEWLAANVFDFFNYINLFYGSISEYCTWKECPSMTAGHVEYPWIDSFKKSVKIPAPMYIDHVFTFIQNSTRDEFVFPTKAGNLLELQVDSEFPKDFINTVKSIFKQLFRVIGHIYHSHYDKILHFSGEGHLNTLTAHFLAFSREFELIDKKELLPLQELLEEFDQVIIK